MSIIIDEIRIPQDREITLRIDEKGEVYVYDTYPTELHKAVEVPDNHGRLIDADVALRSEQPPSCSDEMWNRTTLAKAINNAPTVIPSSNT